MVTMVGVRVRVLAAAAVLVAVLAVAVVVVFQTLARLSVARWHALQRRLRVRAPTTPQEIVIVPEAPAATYHPAQRSTPTQHYLARGLDDSKSSATDANRQIQGHIQEHGRR